MESMPVIFWTIRRSATKRKKGRKFIRYPLKPTIEKSSFWNLDHLITWSRMKQRRSDSVGIRFRRTSPSIEAGSRRCTALQHASIQTCNNFWVNSHSVEGKMKRERERERKRKKYKDFSRLPLSTTQEYLTTLTAIFPRSKMYLPREWRARLWPILTFDDDDDNDDDDDEDGGGGGDVSCQRELSPF